MKAELAWLVRLWDRRYRERCKYRKRNPVFVLEFPKPNVK